MIKFHINAQKVEFTPFIHHVGIILTLFHFTPFIQLFGHYFGIFFIFPYYSKVARLQANISLSLTSTRWGHKQIDSMTMPCFNIQILSHKARRCLLSSYRSLDSFASVWKVPSRASLCVRRSLTIPVVLGAPSASAGER
jgi:hypothetical protein